MAIKRDPAEVRVHPGYYGRKQDKTCDVSSAIQKWFPLTQTQNHKVFNSIRNPARIIQTIKGTSWATAYSPLKHPLFQTAYRDSDGASVPQSLGATFEFYLFLSLLIRDSGALVLYCGGAKGSHLHWFSEVETATIVSWTRLWDTGTADSEAPHILTIIGELTAWNYLARQESITVPVALSFTGISIAHAKVGSAGRGGRGKAGRCFARNKIKKFKIKTCCCWFKW